jgi:hypothetical protein
METLFEGRDLRLNFISSGAMATFVNFNAWSPDKHPVNAKEFSTFAGKIAADMGFNQFNVDTNKNNWYQTDEILKVIDLIQQHNPSGAKIITYGSSMGAYASINFAKRLNAATFIAVSPQYSINPELMHPTDSRWRSEFDSLVFNHDYIVTGECQDCYGYVFYDQGNLDRHHVESILSKTNAVAIPIPHAGHPCGQLINSTYKLKRIMQEVGEGRFDPKQFNIEFNEKLKDTIQYLCATADTIESLIELRSRVLDSKLHIKELKHLFEVALQKNTPEFLKLAMVADFMQHIPPKEVEFVRTGRIEVLIRLKRHRTALFEVAASSWGRSEAATRIISSYPSVSELAKLLPMLKVAPIVLRDAAIKSEKWNVKRSLVIMQRACQIRPDNLLFQRKLKQYNATLGLTESVSQDTEAVHQTPTESVIVPQIIRQPRRRAIGDFVASVVPGFRPQS